MLEQGSIHNCVIITDKKELLRHLRMPKTQCHIVVCLANDYVATFPCSKEAVEREMVSVELHEEPNVDKVTYHAVYDPSDNTLDLGEAAVSSHKETLRAISNRILTEGEDALAIKNQETD